MSTRCNVIIKKGNESVQLYHHHDGYPSGVGQDLFNYFNEIENDEKIWNTPKSLGKWLVDEKRKDEYELEKSIHLHSDIEYLYVIDLDEEGVTCYEVDVWDSNFSNEDFINGKVEEKDVSSERQIYTASMWSDWKDIESDVID